MANNTYANKIDKVCSINSNNSNSNYNNNIKYLDCIRYSFLISDVQRLAVFALEYIHYLLFGTFFLSGLNFLEIFRFIFKT